MLPALAIAGIASAAGSLLGSGINAISGSSTNKSNERINERNNKFNAQEAQKERDWQESMYTKYGTAQAKADQLRAAGLNSQLAGVQADAVPSSGAAASSASPLAMQNPRYGDALSSGVNGALNAISTFSQTEVNDSQKNLLDSNKALADAEKDLTINNSSEAAERVRNLKMQNYILQATADAKISQQFNDTIISQWSASNMEYAARNEMFKYYNLNDAQIKMVNAQTLQYNMNAFKLMADGKLALKDLEYYERNYALRSAQTQAQMLSAKAQMVGSNASMLSAKNQGSYLSKLGAQADEFTRDKKRMNDWLDGKNFVNGKNPTQFERLMMLNYSQSKATLNNLLQQPELVKSQIYSNYVESTTNGIESVLDGVSGFTPAGGLRGVKKIVENQTVNVHNPRPNNANPKHFNKPRRGK